MPVEEPSPPFAGLTEPFPGLRPFESDEELIFRGRQQHADELLRRLAEHRFLAVVGTSGSGKSSLVRAGLLPALDRGYLSGATSRWRIALMRPGMAPIENLAEALRDKEALGAAEAAKLGSSSLGLVEVVREARLAAGESLLVVADQFEELFRYERRMSESDSGAEAALFVSLLLTAAGRPDVPVYVVLTMRSDFLGDCAQFPGLPEALSESQYLIPRLTREQRRQAIEEPLRLFRAAMTPQLVEQLLNDSGDEAIDPAAFSRFRGGAPDSLPVLQHALMRTYLEWKALSGGSANLRIDLTHYATAGRMASALGQHAERLFTEELDDAGRQWAERILRCVTTTELGHPVRRPTLLADLYAIVGARQEDRAKINEVLACFRRRENSFLQVNQDTSVDISHESLIWKWKRLSDWVAKEAVSAELYRDLAKDAHGRATWGEPKLSTALAVRDRDAWNEDWARQYSAERFADVEAFLRRSRNAARKQSLVRWFGIAAAIAVLTLGVMAYYLRSQFSLEHQRAVALRELNDSSSRLLDARKRSEQEQEARIAILNAMEGSTEEDRDRIKREKSDAEARLKQYQEDTQKQQAAQERQSTNLVDSVKYLQNQLDAALGDRDAEAKKRREAESKVAQLEARANSLAKDTESARATTPRPEPARENTPLQPEQAPGQTSAGPVIPRPEPATENTAARPQQAPDTVVAGEGAIKGALGQVLGDVFNLAAATRSMVGSDGLAFSYVLSEQLPGLTEFYVMASPFTLRIYGIFAIGRAPNPSACLTQELLIFEVVKEKYGSAEYGVTIQKDEVGHAWMLTQSKTERRIAINCDEKGELKLAYRDDALHRIAQVEHAELSQINADFEAAHYDKIRPRVSELADQGTLWAETLLGLMYRKGAGVVHDDAKAEEYYRRAAQRGWWQAQYNLGTFYLSQDRYQAAETWLLKAANQGEPLAEENLAQVYLSRSPLQSEEKAFTWFLRAAEDGRPNAQYNTCYDYADGLGVKRDMLEAYKWCYIAARHGQAAAERNTAHLGRQMKPKEIATARDAAERWLAQHGEPKKPVTRK